MNETGNTPEATALAFWAALLEDGDERDRMGGYWLPPWVMRFKKEAILRDFASLDRPGLAKDLGISTDFSDVRYGRIFEHCETIGNQLIEDRDVARWLTIVRFPSLQFWAVAHYGREAVPPEDLPR